MPMIDFRVVVLPAPLRPSSVTTSPGRTSKVTPCRMCDSPYQACSSRTARSGAVSGMPRSHVGLDHLGAARNARIVARCQDLTSFPDGDGVRQLLTGDVVVVP